MTFIAFIQENILLFAGAVAVLAALLTLEFRGLQTRGADLSPTGLSQAVNAGATLVDLRRHDDFRAGHIAGAKNIPNDELETHLNQLGDKEGSLVVYCYAGSVSGKAVRQLRKLGYQNTQHLKGGINAWNADNLPLTKKG